MLRVLNELCMSISTLAQDISGILLWKKFENTRSTNFSYETLITPTKNIGLKGYFKTIPASLLTRLIEFKFSVLRTNRFLKKFPT